jgi:hypothetical protein
VKRIAPDSLFILKTALHHRGIGNKKATAVSTLRIGLAGVLIMTYNNIQGGYRTGSVSNRTIIASMTGYILSDEGKIMKKLATLCAGLLLFLSAGAFAEEHAAAALEHANAAVEHGKAGHAPILVEHAEAALDHAKKAAEVAQGESKTHMDAAVKSLEESISHGKMGHADMATKPAEEAVGHIKAGNK